MEQALTLLEDGLPTKDALFLKSANFNSHQQRFTTWINHFDVISI